MDGLAADRHILDWDETDVHNWLSSLGYSQYEPQIREHKIQGDSLCELDSDGLKSLGITTIGQRLSMLKAIYQVKLAHNVPMDETHYVPPSEAPERVENVNVEKLHSIVKDQAHRLRSLEEDNRNLTSTLQSFVEEFNNIRTSFGRTVRYNALWKREHHLKTMFRMMLLVPFVDNPHSSGHNSSSHKSRQPKQKLLNLRMHLLNEQNMISLVIAGILDHLRYLSIRKRLQRDRDPTNQHQS